MLHFTHGAFAHNRDGEVARCIHEESAVSENFTPCFGREPETSGISSPSKIIPGERIAPKSKCASRWSGARPFDGDQSTTRKHTETRTRLNGPPESSAGDGRAPLAFRRARVREVRACRA